MRLLFYHLPKGLFYPTYLIGVFGYILLLIGSFCCLYKSKWKSGRCYLLVIFTILLFCISAISIRSTRYVFLLAFPFTFFGACFVASFAKLFPRHAALVFLAILFIVTERNTFKVLHADPYSRFYFEAAEKIKYYTHDSDNVLLIGDSDDIGRISFQTGYPYCEYPYPVEDETDLSLLKERFCDKFNSLVFIYSNQDNRYSSLPEALFSVEKSKQNRKLFFTKVDLQPSSSNCNNRIEAENLFVNPLLNQNMDSNAVQRIRNYFYDNPKVLEIVNQDDFFWPYAWPFDNSGRYFPRKDFSICIDKTIDGNQAIHINSDSSLTFFHAFPFSMGNDYQMSLRLAFVEDSEVSISQSLRDLNNNIISLDEIKLIKGNAGEDRVYSIPIYPGKLQRTNQLDRENGKAFFSFTLLYGDVRFSDFYLQAF